MKVSLTCLSVVLLLTGCLGQCDQYRAHITGYTDRCVGGVTYLIFPQAVTVKYTAEGKLVPCRD